PELPAYDLLNLRLGFLNERWDVALFVNNALDERALLALDQERGTLARVGYLTNPPRTIGISSRINF
ncbi:MAG: TonB-dependent receptor, partial [Acidobacteria bacterium]|nr:TonB-dependent receptor [Acidobacteriota bacterium]